MFSVCYAKSGNVNIHWTAINKGARGYSLTELCADVKRLPGGTLWRHNVAGDLPGRGADLDTVALEKLTRANRGRRGFTYTHKTDPATVPALRAATRAGFIVNLSADNAAAADTLTGHGLPVVVVIPLNAPKVTRTPQGRKVVLCPAESSKKITCSNCGLCAIADRDYIIGFRAKGSAKRAADIIARGTT